MVERTCVPDERGRCSLCGDVAVPARLVQVDAATQLGLADSADGMMEVALDCIEHPQVGEMLLVHQGFAIARLEGV